MVLDLNAIDWAATLSVIAVVVAVASAVIAWIAPHTVEDRRQKAVARELKVDCLRRVVALRTVRPKPEWLAALNEICVVFSNSPTVMAALDAFAQYIWKHGGHSNELLVDLIQAMLKDLDISLGTLNDEFILRPFGGA